MPFFKYLGEQSYPKQYEKGTLPKLTPEYHPLTPGDIVYVHKDDMDTNQGRGLVDDMLVCGASVDVVHFKRVNVKKMHDTDKQLISGEKLPDGWKEVKSVSASKRLKMPEMVKITGANTDIEMSRSRCRHYYLRVNGGLKKRVSRDEAVKAVLEVIDGSTYRGV